MNFLLWLFHVVRHPIKYRRHQAKVRALNAWLDERKGDGCG